jgi:hypothetical protein
MVMVELAIPPGLTADQGDFVEMVNRKQIEKFTMSGRGVTLYLGDVRPGAERAFDYTLRARYPVRAQAPAAVTYEYYTPTNRAESRPVSLTVTEAK